MTARGRVSRVPAAMVFSALSLPRDDGYTDACGDCNADCGLGTMPTCGDGELCPQYEDCDDGFTDACGTCGADCTSDLGATCGDGVVCPELEAGDDGFTGCLR